MKIRNSNFDVVDLSHQYSKTLNLIYLEYNNSFIQLKLLLKTIFLK